MKNKVLNPTRQLNVYQFLTSNFNMKSSKFPLFNRNKTQTAVINMAIKRSFRFIAYTQKSSKIYKTARNV